MTFQISYDRKYGSSVFWYGVIIWPGQFFGYRYLYPFAIALCVVWVLEVMNIFESLVVLKIELNHTVELIGLAYSQEFDNIFALSC